MQDYASNFADMTGLMLFIRASTCFPFFIIKKGINYKEFTMESLILAQDER